jgi:hypothetical protein
MRAADCNTGHCMVVARVEERLTVMKQRLQRFLMERLKLGKLN